MKSLNLVTRRFLLGFASFSLLSTSFVQAENLLIVDSFSGKVLAARGAEERRPVASLTKIATVVVALDWAKASNIQLGTRIVVPQYAANLPSSVGLQPGDSLALRDAIAASIMASDNVAALTIADFVGRDLANRNGSGGHPVGAFVAEMNHLAGALGMKKTSFRNPHGLEMGKPGLSTAADIGRLSIYAARNPGFIFYSKQKNRQININRGGEVLSLNLKNSNELVGNNGVDGLKTGTTQAAGPCLVATSEKKPHVVKLPDNRAQITNRRVIVVILNSPDRYGRATAMLQDGWARREAWFAAGSRIQDPEKEQLVVPILR